MISYTIKELTILIQKNKISIVELINEYIQHIKKYHKKYNCFITLTLENAILDAKKISTNSILKGIPIVYKDIFCTKGILTSCASKMLYNFIPHYNAHIVDSFNQDGMIMLGKTNMDEFAMGSSNETSFYGSCYNPWNSSYVSGGSSGGSAVAVCAGFSPAAIGSDTGGSIRLPASFTGITGLKPTYGLVSRFGMIAFASSLDQAGPMAHTAEDCAILLNSMVKKVDKRDLTNLKNKYCNYTTGLNNSLKGLKIGINEEDFIDNNKCNTIVFNAIKEYEKLGAIILPITFDYSKNIALAIYNIISSVEAASNLARYDGIRFGYKSDNTHLINNLNDFYKLNRSESFGIEVKRRIMIGTYFSLYGYDEKYYSKAQKIRHLITNNCMKIFNNVDVIMTPTTPGTAFKIGEKIINPVDMYNSDIYTVIPSLAALPAISIPCGFINSLPVGMQIIASHFQEKLILNVSHRYQELTDWHKKLPSL
jgi:aspartyl-tRNA(Asn)/glutamyl-tRNA(Gln) amidotransferase subunit A